MMALERIPDDALVIRGGRNQPEDIVRATARHPSGVTGISVECSDARSITELAAELPHGQIGVTTVREVRAGGGDVIRTSGRSPFHATLIGLDPTVASRLLTPTIYNPAKPKKV
jgi:hypothetical protein